MRVKLANLSHAPWRQEHPSAHDDNEFPIIGIIDNTMKATCRPGGNLAGGEAAPRVPLAVQQAWYTGYKHLHGLKWQTVLLANGMTFNLWGPISCRKNDNTSLGKSNIILKLELLMQNRPDARKKKIYGDSAYEDCEWLAIGMGRGMSAIRECVEWDYKDVKCIWKYIDWNHVLKIYKQPVSKIVFVCFLLKDAYSCMNANQTSEYYMMEPPSLDN